MGKETLVNILLQTTIKNISRKNEKVLYPMFAAEMDAFDHFDRTNLFLRSLQLGKKWTKFLLLHALTALVGRDHSENFQVELWFTRFNVGQRKSRLKMLSLSLRLSKLHGLLLPQAALWNSITHGHNSCLRPRVGISRKSYFIERAN